MTFPFPIFCPAERKAPVVVSTKASSFPSKATSFSIDLPSGLVAGNLIVLFIGVGGPFSIITISTPSGFTLLRKDSNETGAGRTLWAFYKTATGSEGATVGVSSSISTNITGISYQISGWSAMEASSADGSTTTPDPPALSPSWGSKNTLWLASMVGRAASVSAFPSDYGAIGPVLSGANVVAAAGHLAKRAASENPGTFTQDAADVWVAATVGIVG